MTAGDERLQLLSRSGAYRWFYADVTAGDVTAVFIFMMGAVFSARYAKALQRGGLPVEHSAVNFALYEKGERRLWVFSEYKTARFIGSTLCIGGSQLELLPTGGLRAQVADRTAPWGRSAQAHLELEPLGPPGSEVALVEGQPHWWQPIAPLARATLSVPTHHLHLTGEGYHDTNHGHQPLGPTLAGWRWTRLHRAGETWVDYEPFGTVPSIRVHATTTGVEVKRFTPPATALTRTGWGLWAPRRLAAGGIEVEARPVLLETSPFYARLASHTPGAHALSEVAHFRRFHSPYVRWMAHFRSRQGAPLARGGNP